MSKNRHYNLKSGYMEYFEGETGYKVIPVQTGYIKPGDSYDVIIENAIDFLDDGDFLVISETPLSISQNRLIDETEYKPSISAYFLADIWSKCIWGYVLGPLLGIKKRTIKNLRRLPPEARSHKEVILRNYGWKHALKPASEAGVDLSNAPGSCVSLLPSDPNNVSEDIGGKIWNKSSKNVTVMVIDTDATYKLRNLNFTSLPISINQIKNNMGILGYLLGRVATIQGPTPLGISKPHNIDQIFQIARAAEECQKIHENSMETVYDMEKIVKADVSAVTVEMLDSITHMPAVIVRKLTKSL